MQIGVGLASSAAAPFERQVIVGVSDETEGSGFVRRKVLLTGVALAAQSALTACSVTGYGPPPEPLSRLARGRPAPIEGAVGGRLAISPDGSTLAFEALTINGASPQELFIYERGSGVCTRLSLRERDQPINTRCLALMPSFSPAGDLLAVSARRARPNSAFRRETRPTLLEYADVGVFPWRGGAARRFGERAYYHAYPAFSPLGDRIGAMRSRNPLRSGWHAESAFPLYNGFVEFDTQSVEQRVFSGLEFAEATRFFYETESSLLIAALRPLRLGETRQMHGGERDIGPPETWRVERGTPGGAVLTPAVPIDFAGDTVDRLCGVDREGGVWIQSRGEIIDLPDSQPIELRRVVRNQIEPALRFAGEPCTSPCVARDRPVFAWVTSFAGDDGKRRSAIRIHDGAQSDLIVLNDAFTSLRERTVLT